MSIHCVVPPLQMRPTRLAPTPMEVHAGLKRLPKPLCASEVQSSTTQLSQYQPIARELYIYNVMVVAVLMYGAETWAPKV